MDFFRRIREFWLRFAGRSRTEELEEEIQAHLQIEIDENIEEGMTPEEARYAAQRKFGNALLYREMTEEVWRFAWLDSLLRDIRYALRSFWRSPGFTFTVIGALALGLGSIAVAFSVFNGMVLRPFAVRDPYSLYAFGGWRSSQGRDTSIKGTFTWREFLDFRRENPAFSEVLGYQNGTVPMAGQWAGVQAVTGNYFELLGGRVCMGRALLERDDVSDEGVAVASYDAWKNRLGAEPGIVGSKIRLGKRPVEIVGVACPGFNGPQIERTDFWVSLALSRELTISDQQAGSPQLSILGRLKPALEKESAETALFAYGRQAYAAWNNSQPPDKAYIHQRATVLPLDGAIAGSSPIFLLFGLVLLTACANVSSMMLARDLARRREIGIRISLGAGRARIVRQLLTESLLLAIPAALAAFGLGYVFIRGLFRLIAKIAPSYYLRQGGFQMNWEALLPDLRVLALLVATGFITTLLFGLLPAIQTTRSSLVQANRGEFAEHYRASRLRATLIIMQATLCALLLVLSATAMWNGMRIFSLDLGLDTSGVFEIGTSEKYRRAVLDRLSSLTAASSVSTCTRTSLDFWFGHDSAILYPKFAGESGNNEVQCHVIPVSPEYFDVYKLAVSGRKFPITPLDPSEFFKTGTQDGTDVVVSETAARRLWPEGAALGRIVEERRPDPKSNRTIIYRHTVVGIAADAISELYDSTGALKPNRTVVYFLIPPIEKHRYLESILVRMNGNPGTARLMLQKALDETTPGEMYYEIYSAKEEMDRVLFSYRFLTALEGFLGVIALLMTVFGIFGMLSYMVTQRRKEFGIRIALGANTGRVTRMVLRQSLRLAVAGSLLGSLLALGVARVLGHAFRTPDMRASLWDADTYSFDVSGYAIGVLIVITAALAASWIPARKAVNVDPARILHCD
jgi:predicted permease